MTRALVVGGTGPSGPGVVNGLIARGFDVTILHSGQHEAEFDAAVEHIHADAHSLEALEAALAGRSFDVGIAMYGRLRLVAQALAGKTERVVAVGGVFYRGWINDQFHQSDNSNEADTSLPPYTFPPVPMPESAPMDDNPNNSFARAGVYSEQRLFELHGEGAFAATLMRFPRVYGERATAPIEWSIIRRALDRRSYIILPDGGLTLETKLYAGNASLGVLCAVDHPQQAVGEIFNVGDERPMTAGEWATVLSQAVGHEPQFISIPFDLARPAFPYARDPWTISHHVLDLTKIRQRLGYRPPLPPTETLSGTARYFSQNRPPPGGEMETQLGDPFDYEAEDHFVEEYRRFAERLAEVPFRGFKYRHPYRHPRSEAKP
jgi:nucleoside-diphosphate-sugar epimerase